MVAKGTTGVLNPFLANALEQWKSANTAEEPNRKEWKTDLEFLNLQQWPVDIERDRLAVDKPTLVIDQIGEPYRQLNGQMRSARPALQINPVDSGADLDTADVIQGLIRHVEVTGGAKPAREEGFKGSSGPGIGYYRLLTEYEYDQQGQMMGPELFDQRIVYQPIENLFSVFYDPACPLHEPWKARYCFVIEDMPKTDFEQKWPSKASTSQAAFQATGLSIPEWFPEGSVRVADYYYLEEKDGPELALLVDGSVVPADTLKKSQQGDVIQRRRLTIRTVKLAKISGCEILEGNNDLTEGRVQVWPYIPVIRMWGESIVVEGKRTLRGLVRPARDPQYMYNYSVSDLQYELVITPKSKVMINEATYEKYKAVYEEAPLKVFPGLPYVEYDEQGRPLRQPMPANFTDAAKIQALALMTAQFKADLRSTTGWYDATDPSRKNTDQSGRAILARKEAQSESAVNYKDNFGEALLYEGMLLLGAIPKVYHRRNRILRLLGEDDTPIDPVTIGQAFKRKKSKVQQGIESVFQWGTGRYDVTVSIGASYTTRRQEAADTQMQLVEVLAKTHPPMAAAIAPSVIRNMDIPGSQDLADKADRTLPPEIRNADEEDAQNDPQALQAQLQQSEQKQQEMMQVIQGLQQAVKTDQVKAEADQQKTEKSDAVKLEIAHMEDGTKRDIEAAKIASEERLLKMKLDADLEKARITAAAQAQAQRRQMGFEAASGELEREHEMETAEVTHTHALEQEAAKPQPNSSEASA